MPRVIVGMRDLDPSPALRRAIEEGRLAGLLWFGEALGESVDEAAERVWRLRSLWPAGIPCIFAADEEGGLIQQLCGLKDRAGCRWPRLPSARALGRSGDSGTAFAHGQEVGRRAREIGLDVALAPVVDVDPGSGSTVLGTRCISDEPDRVTLLALAWLRGLASAGVRGCLKHYPGHGATQFDSHRELPRIDPREDRERHLRPFREIARSWDPRDGPPPAVLTAHVVPAGGEGPVTLDPMALAEVPSALGPIWTDSLDMEALASYGDLQARARAALVAGSDLLVVGMDAAGGIAVAQKLEAPVSPRLARWMEGPAPGPIPKAWPMEGIVRTAGAGVRLLQDADLPEGEWEWILPRRLGPYGEVAGPPADVGRGPAARRIARVTRYDAQDPASLKRALTSGTDVFALVGWIHRGWPDPATGEMIQEAGGRVRAIAHLLDGPDGAMIPGIWECETCGFGEGEIAVLQGLWQGGRSSGLRR